ncbi:MAG: hypothetical protein JKY54_17415 [Flavobacteriales bacterium]|nr:hypothetical protein [Flavobacteriales bacterium]
MVAGHNQQHFFPTGYITACWARGIPISHGDTMLENLHAQMLCIAESNHLPETNLTDLNDDLRILKSYKGKSFIWLLRSYGSTLVPIKVGADPAYIVHWLFSSHGQRIVAFLVNSEDATVEKVTFEEAEKLIQQPPMVIPTFISQEDTIDCVDRVLENGISSGVWGLFNSPNIDIRNWEKWLQYFASSRNEPMRLFMDKGLRRLNAFSHERKTAA